MAASRSGAPASTSVRVGARFVNGAPGRCGCAGTEFHRIARCSAPASASAPWTIVPEGSAQPPVRVEVGRNGAPHWSSVRSAVNAMPEKRPPR